MGIVVLGAVFVDIKGYPSDVYIPGGRNAGRVEQMHGGVSRNIVEDIANVELQPTFIGLVDDTGAGADVVRKLKAHKVNTDYIRVTKDGMGTWLAIFDNGGDVVAAISKRPDLRPILSILEEQGDEIISRADSIAFEIDMDKEIVKKVFALAEKYHKPVYAVVSNMSIAVERRDFFRSTHCFVCNQQEAGILFSEDYDDKTPEEMQRLLAARIRSAQIPRMVVTMGAQGHERRRGGLVPRQEGGREGHHRRGRRLLRGRDHRPDLRQDDGGGLRDRHAAGRVGHLHIGKRLPALSAERVRHRPERA